MFISLPTYAQHYFAGMMLMMKNLHVSTPLPPPPLPAPLSLC